MTTDQRIHLDHARAAFDQALLRHAAARRACLDAIYEADGPTPDFHALRAALSEARNVLDITTLALRIAEARINETDDHFQKEE